MSGDMKYRLRAGSLNDANMQKYAGAVKHSKQINDNRGYYHFSGLHGAPGRWCWHHQFSQRSNLSGRLFLPWHRAYLHRYEQSLQDIDPDVSLPWWDWTAGIGLPDSFLAAKFNDSENPLLNAHIRLNPPHVSNQIDQITTRAPADDLPVFSSPSADADGDGRVTLKEAVDFLIHEVTNFEDFNDNLENIHDALHGYVGGSMANVAFSAYDPIFYSHHCMIDRVWALWQQNKGIENFPSGLRHVVLEPFGLTAAEVLNTQELGYEYADSMIEIDLSSSEIAG